MQKSGPAHNELEKLKARRLGRVGYQQEKLSENILKGVFTNLPALFNSFKKEEGWEVSDEDPITGIRTVYINKQPVAEITTDKIIDNDTKQLSVTLKTSDTGILTKFATALLDQLAERQILAIPKCASKEDAVALIDLSLSKDGYKGRLAFYRDALDGDIVKELDKKYKAKGVNINFDYQPQPNKSPRLG